LLAWQKLQSQQSVLNNVAYIIGSDCSTELLSAFNFAGYHCKKVHPIW